MRLFARLNAERYLEAGREACRILVKSIDHCRTGLLLLRASEEVPLPRADHSFVKIVQVKDNVPLRRSIKAKVIQCVSSLNSTIDAEM
jgi:hypothetical protein